MFLSDSQTLSELADALKVDVAALPGYWAGINSRNHGWAYQQIVGILASRGFTAAQAAAFDAGPDAESDLTLHRNLVRGAGAHDYDDRFIQALDRREELRTCPVLNGGVFQNPTPGGPGTCSTGALGTGGDLFVWPDPADKNLGQVTEF